jgi:F-type H+-transporting ATPase subunit c
MKKAWLGFVSLVTPLLVSASALAQEAAATNENDIMVYAYLSAGFAIGIAALGGTLGQGRATAAALDGIARNPKARPDIFVPMILGLALIESLVIYALVIALVLVFK